ncbi:MULTISPECIES: prolyl oligopeptidase family serine peptidase [Oleiagrimonas]|uniref:S9 family peptidase n=1 Tax=Oleiagrimonas citrea TaxID=1665687 RepID=A0A846ZR01_9GAMM|nr:MULTISPECIES: prolyl oligopeptidase family serine peptidase [Oleiagrimonas]NKZ39958.1 S9 family peptidase [Oleiagrimonas citrea]RAP56988.1 S9 family peptidase [Oleiagrimonas sp. MCCC 1A03011]
MKAFGLFLVLCVATSGASIAFAAPPTPGDGTADPYLWLEKTHGERAMQWVHEQNARTEKRFADNAQFERTRKAILGVLDSDARIPYVHRRGKYLYNFWKDKQHPRGLWRRTTLAEYRKDAPTWQTLLDIDALGKAEGRKWVFKGAQCMKPAYRRCLVELSPDGGDAVEVREFDVATRSFVKNGFHLPVAKTDVDWIDRDHIYVGTDFGPGSMTKSSYPRIVKEWTRGTPLKDARTIYAGKKSDLAISASHDRTPGYERDFVYVVKDFFHSELYQRKDGKLIRVDVPLDAQAGAHRQWLLVQTKSPWTTGGKTWPSGALLAIKYDAFMAGKRDFTALFTPDAHTALSSYSWTRHHLILDTLKDVQSRLEVLTPHPDGSWSRKPLAGAPALSTVRVVDTDPDHDDAYWIDVTGFLTPSTLERGVIGAKRAEKIKQAPSFFDASAFTVSQHFATSKDGTRVPYFEIAPKGIKPDGSNRTLLYGYGGFEVSLLPRYSGSIGRAWLERGGVYVIANIRGGGEYGPRWHKAALKANRPKAYQDFAAVAKDLIRRGVTSPSHLGAEGGSNGGLLMGNMLVSYPQLFGAIACEVPLLDMKRYIHLDAGASWIGEYGNPDDPKQWSYIKTFSPYQLVKKGVHYPPVLFYTTTSDDRVGPAQARKMAAKMEGMGYRNVWFYENTEGGHGAGADNKQSAHMHALAWNFLWNQLQ